MKEGTKKRTEDVVEAITGKEGASKGVVAKQVKRTKGKVDALNGTKAWAYMMQRYGLAGEQLVNMRQAICPAKVEGKPVNLVRIFKPADAKEKGVTVDGYESLNEHPELILYEGYYSQRVREGDIIIDKIEGGAPTSLAEKIKDGAVTDIGVVDEAAGQKSLGGFGKFLMAGGWLLLVFVILGIVILISVLTSR